mgnify:CR=1 FL=1
MKPRLITIGWIGDCNLFFKICYRVWTYIWKYQSRQKHETPTLYRLFFNMPPSGRLYLGFIAQTGISKGFTGHSLYARSNVVVALNFSLEKWSDTGGIHGDGREGLAGATKSAIAVEMAWNLSCWKSAGCICDTGIRGITEKNGETSLFYQRKKMLTCSRHLS